MGFLLSFVAAVGGSILFLLNTVLATLNWLVPDIIGEAIVWALTQVSYFSGWFPVGQLMGALAFMVGCYVFKYQIRIFLEVIFPLIPLIGRHIHLPTHDLGGHSLTASDMRANRRNLRVAQRSKFRRVLRGDKRI